jgi:hypothetical protein
MHLHGFYYRIDAKGDGARDTLLTPAMRRMTVTEIVNPGETMAMSFLPIVPGTGSSIVISPAISRITSAMDTEKGVAAPENDSHHMADAPHQMYGLVMG